MMRAFRNSAKPLIFIVAVSFFAWLVFDLSGLTGGTGLLTETSVGRINGRTIDARLFQQAVAQATEARQRQTVEPLGLAEAAQIRDQVWEQFIQETLLEAEYRRWGISVATGEISAAIRSSPPSEFYGVEVFQTDGQFDPVKYERWLASAEGQSVVPSLEAQYRSNILQAKLARHLLASVTISEPGLWERYQDEHEQVRVGSVTLDPVALVSETSIRITPAEVEEFYQARRETFRREALAWVSYVEVDRQPIASDTVASRERALALRAEILGGTPFEEVARRESIDTVSGNRGGDLGEWTSGTFDADFERAASALSPGTVSEPVETSFGFHLIEVTARRGDTLSGRHILVPIEVTGDHRDFLDARADSLEHLAADRLDPAALDTAARALGLTITRIGPIRRDAQVTVVPDVAVWAFQARPGEHSPVIEGPTSYLVARLDSLHPEGIPALATIRPVVEAQVRARKRLDETRALANQIRASATQPGGTLRQAAAAFSLAYEELGPLTRVTAPFPSGLAIGAAFALAPGEVSEVITAEGAVYLLEGISRTPADSAAFVAELPTLREQALDNVRNLYLRQYMTALRTQARIVDNRHRIYRTAAQIEAEAGN